MKRRFSIWVREVGSDHDVELMQLDGDPAPVVKALHAKSITIQKSIFEAGKRKSKIPRYTFVRVADNSSGD
ncbi:hypothetical protein M2232_002324 [Bradyrhizobium japonicum]|uniref:hypothetical protein n=1 Tax=Bradyrhizobium japonicum TaxID=375 RepID=UPI002226FFB4|nr:hypothetical protein [Bradyrhizobium japonicum]MCW2218792.1 hypothetical protein [Bradyrhizobium japonicum]MCW2343406.1 hypothetical protein [Bradyrhizobium japonicum]